MRPGPWAVLANLLTPEDLKAVRDAGLEVTWAEERVPKRPGPAPSPTAERPRSVSCSIFSTPLSKEQRSVLATWQRTSLQQAVADEIGISRNLLSEATNGHPISDNTRRKIEAAIKRGRP